MLVLIDIKKSNKSITVALLPSYYQYKNSKRKEYNDISFDILNTNTNKIYNMTLDELYEYLEDTSAKEFIGVVHKSQFGTTLKPLDVLSWKLLDFIHDVEMFEYNYDFIYSRYDNIKYEQSLKIGDSSIQKFQTNRGTVYKVSTTHKLQKIDKYGLFWLDDDKFITLSHLYKVIYGLNDKDCIALYLSNSIIVVRLEVNENIIRLMAKAKVLGDKLCW